MKSLRQIEREYNRMLSHHKEPVAPEKYNVYTCVNNHSIKTINVDNGVTPMLLACAVCQTLARSTWFTDTRPDLEASHEFYRPDLLYTMKKLRKDSEMLNHVLNGGLILRRIAKTFDTKNDKNDTENRGIVLK